MVWVYDRTRSLLVVMLMHMPIVVSQFVLTPEGISGEQMFMSLIATGVVLWLLVGGLVLAKQTKGTGGRGARALATSHAPNARPAATPTSRAVTAKRAA